MRVFFLRHGKAVSRAEWQGDDSARPLTPEGEVAMRREAETMRGMDLGLDAIVTSPLVRARQTADIVAAGLGMAGGVVEDECLAHGLDARRLAELVAAHASAEALMVVGHEPDFSATVSELIGGGTVVFKKGGLARVDLTAPEPGGGQLLWLLTPPLLGSG